MGKLRHMNDHRQIKFRLKETEMYLQFLNEDLDLAESIDERIASQVNQLLKEDRKLFRESANLFNIEIEKNSLPTP